MTTGVSGIIGETKYSGPAVLLAPRPMPPKELASMNPNDNAPQIPYGYCHCGCGQKTSVSRDTIPKFNAQRGQPRKYIRGHNNSIGALAPVFSERGVLIPVYSRKYPGHFALIDEEDYDLVSQYRWHVSKNDQNIYARANVSNGPNKNKTIFMHRLILGLGPVFPIVDHANHNGIDNRRQNIRICTNQQNTANARRVPGIILVSRSFLA